MAASRWPSAWRRASRTTTSARRSRSVRPIARRARRSSHDAGRIDALSVPLLDLEPQYKPLRGELLAAVTRVCDSQRFIMGPEVDALERELAALLRVKHAITVSSGTDALLLA